MTQAVANILQEAEQLSLPERADLTEQLVERLAGDMRPEIERAHLDEVRRRIAHVESGEVALIAGDQALAQVRRMVEAALRPS